MLRNSYGLKFMDPGKISLRMKSQSRGWGGGFASGKLELVGRFKHLRGGLLPMQIDTTSFSHLGGGSGFYIRICTSAAKICTYHLPCIGAGG